MTRLWVHILFGVLYALLLFYGIGPVLLADGSDEERLGTLAVVTGIAVVLVLLHRRLLRRARPPGGRSRL